MQFKVKQKRKVLINITSLIDVLFLLLIFFMVSSTFLEQPGIKLELPHAENSLVVEQKDYTLYVDKDGGLFLNKEQLDIGKLEDALSKVISEMKDGALVLKADQEVAHGVVVKVMDAAKRSGVKKLVIGTRLEE